MSPVFAAGRRRASGTRRSGATAAAGAHPGGVPGPGPLARRGRLLRGTATGRRGGRQPENAAAASTPPAARALPKAARSRRAPSAISPVPATAAYAIRRCAAGGSAAK